MTTLVPAISGSVLRTSRAKRSSCSSFVTMAARLGRICSASIGSAVRRIVSGRSDAAANSGTVFFSLISPWASAQW